MLNTIDIFTKLGERLAQFGKSTESIALMERAVAENSWFTHEDIERAVKAICDEMLCRDKLSAWLAKYSPTTEPKRVAVIMAGNIPLVGFFDLLCVIASGHECHLKPSSKDRVLMQYIVEQLLDIEPTIAIYDYSSTDHYDMAIATGGEDANRYFSEHFASTRRLLRGSRHSIAVLTGMESEEELVLLNSDITAYSGLGCRSVSMLFTPRGKRPNIVATKAANRKLERNIASIRALMTMQQRPYIDCGAYLLVDSEKFTESLALVALREYDDIKDVKVWIEENRDSIQCIVSNAGIEESVAFGRAQYPTLWDYADGVDTMRFLLG